MATQPPLCPYTLRRLSLPRAPLQRPSFPRIRTTRKGANTMAGYPPPYPPPTPPPGPPYGNDWKYQRRVMKDQARMQRDMLRAQQQAYRQQLRSMRRGSVLGPLMVIAIGVVFLLVQTGRIAGHDLWLWYGRWWPALLVGAGLVMLLEWAVDQYLHSGETPLRRRSIGG